MVNQPTVSVSRGPQVVAAGRGAGVRGFESIAPGLNMPGVLTPVGAGTSLSIVPPNSRSHL